MLDELVGMRTSPEREAQRESGGHQSPPTAGAAWRGAVPHYRRNSPIVEAWLHAGRVISCGSWRVQQQPLSYDGRMIVGKELVGRLTQPTPGAARMLCHIIAGTLFRRQLEQGR